MSKKIMDVNELANELLGPIEFKLGETVYRVGTITPEDVDDLHDALVGARFKDVRAVLGRMVGLDSKDRSWAGLDFRLILAAAKFVITSMTEQQMELAGKNVHPGSAATTGA